MFDCYVDEMRINVFGCMLNMLIGSSLPVLLYDCVVYGCSSLR